jgi:methionine synthase I (cobalamin-dependent)
MGTMTQARATEIYTHQAGIIEAQGVDLFILETFFDLNEALSALAAIQAVSTRPVIVSLTFQQTPRGFFTLVGNPVEASMKTLADSGAAAVGANCSMGSETMVDLAAQIRQSVSIPVIIQPNAGLPLTGKDGSVSYPEDGAFFSKSIQAIKALGIEIVGGCCGTTPGIMQRVCQAVKSQERP